MKALKYILIIVLLIVLLGIGYFVFKGKLLPNSSGVAAVGAPYNCQFNYDNEVANSSGVVYSDGHNLRGDFQNSLKKVSLEMETHLIQRDGYTYLWSPETGSGYKAKSAPGDINPQYMHDCQEWTPEADAFDLPADITFTEAQAS